MRHEDVIRVLDDPLAQKLMRSSIPARLAYTAPDGSPRVVPVGFYWDGTQLVMGTEPTTPKVDALRANPKVALTIDTNVAPHNVLLIRGTASVELVDGVFPEYVTAGRKLVPADQQDAWEATARATLGRMARITITPEWAKLMDFETRVPDFLHRIAARGNTT